MNIEYKEGQKLIMHPSGQVDTYTRKQLQNRLDGMNCTMNRLKLRMEKMQAEIEQVAATEVQIGE